MDHLLENEGKPVPDLSSVSATATSSSNAAPADDDEELEALKAVYGHKGGLEAQSAAANADVEAKVSDIGPDINYSLTETS